MGRKFKRIFAVCIIIITSLVIYVCVEEDPLTLTDSVQEYLVLQGYDTCYLTRFPNQNEIEEKKVIVQVGKEEIDNHIEFVLSENSYRQPISNRNKVEMGDLALSDYTVIYNEKIVGNVEDAPIRVGSGHYDVFLENSLIGIEVGEEHVINWKVPDDYRNKEWAGKDLIIHITVKEIFQVIKPSIDKYILDNGFDTLEEYEAYIKTMLIEDKRTILFEEAVESIIDDFIAESRFKIDDDIVVDNAVQYYYSYRNLANVCDEDVNNYVSDGTDSMNNIYEICYRDSLREIQRYLIIGRYAEENHIVVEEKDVENYCQGKDVNLKGLNEQDKVHIKYQVVEQKVLQHLGQKYVNINLM